MATLLRILPIFAVILAGLFGRRIGLLPETFQRPANRIVYVFAIPCLIFLKVVRAPFHEILRPGWIGASVVAIFAVWLASIPLSRRLGLRGGSRGTFAQASIHANLGYIGLAAAFYGLGERGLQSASVFAPFFMLVNNTLAVLALSRFGTRGAASAGRILRTLVLHPIILSAFAGILWSWAGLPLPRLMADTLGILADMALPLALLLIGAGLSLEALHRPAPVLLSATLKNLALPTLGAALLTLAGAGGVDRAAAVLLLSAPSATVTLILAREMGGDTRLASALITVSTAASAATLPLWLGLLGG